MNDVLDFLGALRGAANVYLWVVLGVSVLLLVADLTKSRAQVKSEESEMKKAA